MKEIVTKKYRCEICGTEYTERVKCKRCEESHRKPLEIVGGRYISHTNDESGYPITIDVKMSDKKIVRYRKA